MCCISATSAVKPPAASITKFRRPLLLRRRTSSPIAYLSTWPSGLTHHFMCIHSLFLAILIARALFLHNRGLQIRPGSSPAVSPGASSGLVLQFSSPSAGQLPTRKGGKIQKSALCKSESRVQGRVRGAAAALNRREVIKKERPHHVVRSTRGARSKRIKGIGEDRKKDQKIKKIEKIGKDQKDQKRKRERKPSRASHDLRMYIN